MILAIDIGNTNLTIGCFEGEQIYFAERLSTDLTRTDLEYAVSIKTILELYGIKENRIRGGIISSVVPPLTKVIAQAAKSHSQTDKSCGTRSENRIKYSYGSAGSSRKRPDRQCGCGD